MRMTCNKLQFILQGRIALACKPSCLNIGVGTMLPTSFTTGGSMPTPRHDGLFQKVAEASVLKNVATYLIHT